MFTIRVNWATTPPEFETNHDDPKPKYSVYSGAKYTVVTTSNCSKTLYIDEGVNLYASHELLLGNGDRVYVMNDAGATIDTITT